MSINDDIKNYKSEIEDIEDYFTCEETLINEITDKINKLGKFIRINNSKYLKFK